MKFISLEDQIIKATITALLDAGYLLSVYDGGEVTVNRSNDSAAIFEAMKTTDEDYLFVFEVGHVRYRQGDDHGWVRFVYGNDDTEVINDYTVSLEPVMANITAMIDEYEGN